MTHSENSASAPHLPDARLWVGPLLVAIGAMAVGLAPIGLRLGLETLGPLAIAQWRYIFATPILFTIILLYEKRLPYPPNKFILLAGLFFAIDISLWHIALTKTSVSNATFIVNLGSVSVGFLAWIFLKERPKALWFLSVALAVAGAAALSLGGQESGAGPAEPAIRLQGDLIALCAAVSLSFYFLFSKMGRNNISALDAIFWLTVTEAVVQTIFVLVSDESMFPAELRGYGAPLFIALAAQVVGQGCIIAGLGRTPASIAGVLILLQPVVAAIISWRMFNEPLTALQFAGAGVILLGVWLAQRSNTVRKKSLENT